MSSPHTPALSIAPPVVTRRTRREVDAAANAPARIDHERSDAILALLDAGSLDIDPRLAAANDALGALENRGHRRLELVALNETMAGCDPTEIDALTRHRCRTGKPPGLAVAPTAHELNVGDLFEDCPIAADMAQWVAGAVECAPDMPALMILGLVPVAVACKAISVIDSKDPADDIRTGPPAFFLGIEAGTGVGKSAALKMCGVKLLDQRKAKVQTWHAAMRRKQSSQQKLAKNQIAPLEAKLAKSTDPTTSLDLGEQIAALEEITNAPAITTPDWLQWAKITPENFVRHINMSGFVALVSDEGKETLEAFGGDGGKNKGNVAPLLSAGTGSMPTNSTINGDTHRKDGAPRFDAANVAVVLALQESTLAPSSPEQGRALAEWATRGLLPRFLLARARVVTQTEAEEIGAAHDVAKLDPAKRRVRAQYDALFSKIANEEGDKAGETHGRQDRREEEQLVGVGVNPLRPCRPWVFTFDDDAAERLTAWGREMRNSGRPGGSNHGALTGLLARFGMHAQHVAHTLAILRQGGITGGGVINLRDVERAIRFMEGYILPQARAIYERTVFAPAVDDAEIVLAKIREVGQITYAALRDNHFKRSMAKVKGEKVSRLDAALALLKDRGEIEIVLKPNGSKLIRYAGR